MKNLIVPILVCLFSFGSVNAKNIDVNNNTIERITYDVSSFCKLIQKGDFESIKFLIESGEDVNQKSKGLTPLMFAARHNKADIAKLLIENGAKLESRSDKRDLTALEVAEKFKATDAMTVLKDALKK